MRIMETIIKSAALLLLILSLVACFGENKQEPPVGTDPSVAARTQTIPTGDNECLYGGILLETGIDENSNGVLDANEVDVTKKVCNGTPGADGSNGENGLQALVNTISEPAGVNCLNGGLRLDTGLDNNRNGTLEAEEVVASDYTCNGAAGANGAAGLNSLINMSPERVGVNCSNGGLRIDTGLDTNRNEALDPDEITQTGFVCSGADGGTIGWQIATLIESDNTVWDTANSPQVAMDNQGNAIAIWSQHNGTRFNIRATRYVDGTGWWDHPSTIDTSNTGDAISPQVAVDDSGNALAVWSQYDGVRNNIWANRYIVNMGWGTAELIENDDTGNADSPQIDMDNQGNSVVVWQQHDGIRKNIWANRYVMGDGWSSAELIEIDNANASSPQIAIDVNGSAMAVWLQSDGIRNNTWANRYVTGSGWGNAEIIVNEAAIAALTLQPELNILGESYSPQVAVDSGGNAIAVWRQTDGPHNMWANRYVVGVGWGTAELIESDDVGYGYTPQIAIDGSGNAVVVWDQSANSLYKGIWANRYVVGSGWGIPELIKLYPGQASSPEVAVADNGNAIVVWQQQHNDYIHSIWSNQYVVGMGWGKGSVIETETMNHAFTPKISVNSSGNAMAVWHQSDGTRDNIWANEYIAQ